MTFYERAWKERVKTEDKAMLEHTCAMREAIRRGGTPSLSGSSVRSGSAAGGRRGPASSSSSIPPYVGTAKADAIKEYNTKYVAPAVGSSMVPKSLPSISGSSVRSSQSTQLSHQGASTVAASSKFTSKSQYDRRIEALESALQQEKETKVKIESELAEIKELLLEQRKDAATKRRVQYGRPPLGQRKNM